MRVLRLICILFCVCLINGCTTIGYTTASVIGNKLSIGTQIDDEILEQYAENRIDDLHLGDANRIVLHAYDRNILLTGQVQSQAVSDRVALAISSIRGLRTIYNYLEIKKPTSTDQWLKDAYLTGKIKTSILFSNASHFRFDVFTEDGVVYLVGSASKAEEQYVYKRVKHLKGVKRVVKLFFTVRHKKAPILSARL